MVTNVHAKENIKKFQIITSEQVDQIESPFLDYFRRAYAAMQEEDNKLLSMMYGDFESKPLGPPPVICPPVLKQWLETTLAFLKANPPEIY